MLRRRVPRAAALGALAAALSIGTGAEPTRILDLATFGTPAGELTRIFGSSGDGSAGVPVAGGADVDGDGFPDSGFSSVMAGPLGRMGAGEMFIVFGTGPLGGSVFTANFGTGLLKIAGQHVMEVAGVEIEFADVTGDGIGDVLIGRQNHTPTGARPGAGALTILVGGQALRDHAATLAHLDLGAIPPAIQATTFVGPSSYDRLGIWMRTGDIDGDGIADIAVGADEVDQTADVAANNGAVYVIRGGAHLATTQTIDLATFGTVGFPAALEGHVALVKPPVGTSTKYHLGATVQIGDLDGDLKGEVIATAALARSNAGLKLAGAPAGTGETFGGSPQGTVFIAWDDNFPSTPWAAGYTIDLGASSMSLTRVDGSVANPTNGEFGEELLAGLDYDGDGNPDLFAGDLTGNGGNGTWSGLGHVLSHPALLKGMTVGIAGLIASPPAGVRHTLILGPGVFALGADTAVHGDYDGDGLADLGFCNPKDQPAGRASAGTVHVIYGEDGGWPAVVDLKPAELPSPAETRIVEIQGAHATSGADGGDTLCYSATGGDVDDDGVPDLLINEMEGNGFTADGGDPGDELDPIADVGNLLLIGGAPLLERVLLDIDGDGDARPLTDGVMLMRYLFGITAPAQLTEGALGTGATRTGPEIVEYLSRAGAALDADGDGLLDDVTDGILALRYLFGFRDAELIAGALGGGATRTDADAVESFLERLVP